MNKIDAFLNKITMYRIVLYGLLVIVVWSFVLSVMGVLSYSIGALSVSLAVVLVVGLITHVVFKKAFDSLPSTESWIITVLILFLILRPTTSPEGLVVLALGVLLATASKYILAIKNRHIFNPVAIALVTLGLLGSGETLWWVGSAVMLPVVAVVGLLIIRKTRRIGMVAAFLATALTIYVVLNGLYWDPIAIWKQVILSGPIFFFATIMFTEPATSPATRRGQFIYAMIVGVVYELSFAVGPLYSTPELALVVGNIFAWLISSKEALRLRLIRQVTQSPGVYEFIFMPDRRVKFTPGQYMEWTLSHKNTDSRGNRRYFTIASAPEDKNVRLGVRIDPEHASSFKKALLALPPGVDVGAGHISGSFGMPHDPDKKLVFIAGGIGITPFRSMILHLIENNRKRDIDLFYFSQTHDGFSFWPTFEDAKALGVKIHYVITGQDVPKGWSGKVGFLTPDMITTEVPDYKNAIFYLSGPNGMVTGYKKTLRNMGVPSHHIKTDYFPGF